tara:strand:- start:817 stop:1677 length:861 start_codon:yes stop_codon:yes gene_type:complete
MKEAIEQFVNKLNEEGILSEDQIKGFEELGSEIQKQIEEKAEAEKEKAIVEAKEDLKIKLAESEAHHDAEIKKIEETFDSVVEKLNTISESKIKLALYNYKLNEKLSFNEEKVVEGIDKYLSTVVEDHLPEQPVVDYAKLDKLEKTFESMRDTLLITNDDVQTKVDNILEDVQEELSQKSDLLNDAIKRNIEYKTKLDKIDAENTLSEKVSDLPEFERTKLEKVFSESTSEEINEAFEKELEKIQTEDFETEEVDNSAPVIQEKVEEAQSELDMYAQLAERFLPKR